MTEPAGSRWTGGCVFWALVSILFKSGPQTSRKPFITQRGEGNVGGKPGRPRSTKHGHQVLACPPAVRPSARQSNTRWRMRTGSVSLSLSPSEGFPTDEPAADSRNKQTSDLMSVTNLQLWAAFGGFPADGSPVSYIMHLSRSNSEPLVHRVLDRGEFNDSSPGL